MKILVLTKYDKKGASSRLRTIQYFPFLQTQGIDIDYSPLLDSYYLDTLYKEKSVSVLYVMKRYFKRIRKLFNSYKYDLLWIEKELFPWIPLPVEKWLSLMGIKYLVDYDDAIFHNYDAHRSKVIKFLFKRKIPNVMKYAQLVTVCNGYLKGKALEFGANKIEIIPTVVDLKRYKEVLDAKNTKLHIGWIGSPATEKYLLAIEDVFRDLQKILDFKLIIVGGRNFNMKDIDYTILEWSEEREAEYIEKMDIGIMPIPSDGWGEGKCGYKMIQYMACAKPVVVTNVDINRVIINDDKNGYIATTKEEWIEAIIKLSERSIRVTLGKEARVFVKKNYSLEVTLENRLRSIKESI